ncbi:MAG: hydrolase [Pseudonocardiales bacterium]|nr:hydrolase [Pseudonocardiales bacterium]
MTTPEAYAVVGSEPIFRGRVISLRRDKVRMSDGAVVEREVVDHPGAVGVVAIDDDGKLLLVNQYRHPIGARLDELPAGLLDVDGEPAVDAARRELAEEAAVTASDWQVLLDLHPSPGFSNEAIRLYLARGLVPIPEAERHKPEHEEITLTVERVPIAEAVRRVYAGDLTNAAAVAGILATAHAQATGWTGLRPADAPWPARPGH